MQLLLRLQQAEVHTESVQRVSQWIATPYPEYTFVRLRQLNLLPLNVAFGDGHMSIHVCVYMCVPVCASRQYRGWLGNLPSKFTLQKLFTDYTPVH